MNADYGRHKANGKKQSNADDKVCHFLNDWILGKGNKKSGK